VVREIVPKQHVGAVRSGARKRRYPGPVTHLDLRSLKLRSGEQFHDSRQVRLEPLELGGQRYLPFPEEPSADLTVTRTSSGLLFELALEARLHGPCFRCMGDAALTVAVRGREYQATGADETDDELRSPYIADAKLDLSAWARDALALALPDKILCREDCAGLCSECGKNLNIEPHEHEAQEADPRWAALGELRDQL
jgi:uncharacterized protein